MPIPYIVQKSLLLADVREAYDLLEPLVRNDKLAEVVPEIHALLDKAMHNLFIARTLIDDL